jgi:hypothetical protein
VSQGADSKKTIFLALGANLLIEATNRCEVALRHEFPRVRWCFFEPDLE